MIMRNNWTFTIESNEQQHRRYRCQLLKAINIVFPSSATTTTTTATTATTATAATTTTATTTTTIIE